MNRNQNNGEQKKVPGWYKDGNLNEVAFLHEIRSRSHIRYVRGRFYDEGEHLLADEELQRVILDELKRVYSTNLYRKSMELLNLMRKEWFYDVLDKNEWIIHLANGTWDAYDSTFEERKRFTLRRMQVEYDPDAPKPERFLDYLNQLLEPEDIVTLQEYLGYCLVPSTKGQKMLVISGKGGEGKSVLGQILGGLWGEGLMYSSIQKISTDRFARATLVDRLVMVDDDMSLEALPQTHVLKTLITLTGRTDVEQKGIQSYQAVLYARFLGFTNGSISALYDKSYGFYRRLILLKTKDRPKDRQDQAQLAEAILYDEKPGIFLWLLEGLERYLSNGFKFTISEQAQKNLEEVMREADPIADFLDSRGYFTYDPQGRVTSADLYEVYKQYCQDNLVRCVNDLTFQKRIREPLVQRGAVPTKHVPNRSRKDVRGYLGIRLNLPPGWAA